MIPAVYVVVLSRFRIEFALARESLNNEKLHWQRCIVVIKRICIDGVGSAREAKSVTWGVETDTGGADVVIETNLKQETKVVDRFLLLSAQISIPFLSWYRNQTRPAASAIESECPDKIWIRSAHTLTAALLFVAQGPTSLAVAAAERP